MKSFSSTHQFAFYTELIASLSPETRLEIYYLLDPELILRIVSVLRLEKGDKIVLFNSYQHVMATIIGIEGKRTIALQIHEVVHNKQLSPQIHWLLPLLKRDAFEEALYTLTELGATSIQPLLTQKTNRFWAGEKEVVRCQKIMIAAAEQAKQFVIPQMHPIIPLDIWLLKSRSPQVTELFFDPAGIPLAEALALIEHQRIHEIYAFAGPEGDLTYEEKMMLTDRGFVFCALTPTVLRAQQAVAVGLGVLRSLLGDMQ